MALVRRQGFITACAGGSGEEALKICQMPMRVHLDLPWPLQKVPLRATPHRLAYSAESRLYVILTSRPVRPVHPHACLLHLASGKGGCLPLCWTPASLKG